MSDKAGLDRQPSNNSFVQWRMKHGRVVYLHMCLINIKISTLAMHDLQTPKIVQVGYEFYFSLMLI